MVEKRDVELTSPYKYIKNTSACGTILTEYLLKACRRSHKPKLQERSLCNQVEQREKGEELG